MRSRYLTLSLLLFVAAACGAAPGGAQPSTSPSPGSTTGKGEVILATTTSTQDSGLLDVLVPRFEATTGYRLKAIAVGTGQALQLGTMGEADALLAHAPGAEKEFMATGAGANRKLVMYNDFVILGPASDPAGIKGMTATSQALEKIASTSSPFYSRGDDSGTHKKELDLWDAAGTGRPNGDWYEETGSGMGQTLRVVSEKRGYTLSDRGTYLSLQDTLELEIVLEGDPPLLNIYHVMQVSPERFPRVNGAGGQAFVEFMVSPEAQKLIGDFGRQKFGQPLFTPCARNSCSLEDPGD